MNLPALKIESVEVEAADVAPDEWAIHFPHYLIRRQDFFKDIDKQMSMLEMITYSIGLGANAMNLLAGLSGDGDPLKTKVSTLRQWIGLQKAPGVVELAKDYLDVEPFKLVICGVNPTLMGPVREGLREYGAATLYNGTPDIKRRKLVRRFLNDPRMRVLVLAMNAVRPDIILPNAHEILIAEASWKREQNAAAILRVHNRYQTQPVRARFVGLKNSAEAKLTRLLKNYCRHDVEHALDGLALTDF